MRPLLQRDNVWMVFVDQIRDVQLTVFSAMNTLVKPFPSNIEGHDSERKVVCK
jgi:hypothetical protein